MTCVFECVTNACMSGLSMKTRWTRAIGCRPRMTVVPTRDGNRIVHLTDLPRHDSPRILLRCRTFQELQAMRQMQRGGTGPRRAGARTSQPRLPRDLQREEGCAESFNIDLWCLRCARVWQGVRGRGGSNGDLTKWARHILYVSCCPLCVFYRQRN